MERDHDDLLSAGHEALAAAEWQEFVRATSTPAQSRTLPPPPDGPPSEEEQRRIRDAIRAHGCEVLE
jgi:hypothetical protein